MQKLFLLLFCFSLLSCTEKEKTYEELEAEVLCDVLPEILERELKFYPKLPPPPPPLNCSKYTIIQLDSIREQNNLSWNSHLEEFKKQYKKRLSEFKEFKKVEQKILDTLINVKKLSVDETDYKKNDLDCRRIELKEFDDSYIKVKLVSYKNTFEQQERSSGDRVLFLTRVLVDEKEENSFFTVFRFFSSYHVFCRKGKDNKWKIRKIIHDEDNKLRSE